MVVMILLCRSERQPSQLAREVWSGIPALRAAVVGVDAFGYATCAKIADDRFHGVGGQVAVTASDGRHDPGQRSSPESAVLIGALLDAALREKALPRLPGGQMANLTALHDAVVVGKPVRALRFLAGGEYQTAVVAPRMVQTPAHGGLYLAEETGILGEIEIITNQHGQKRAVVERVIGQRRLLPAGTVDGLALCIDAVGDTAVGALPPQQVENRCSDLLWIKQVTGIIFRLV